MKTDNPPPQENNNRSNIPPWQKQLQIKNLLKKYFYPKNVYPNNTDNNTEELFKRLSGILNKKIDNIEDAAEFIFSNPDNYYLAKSFLEYNIPLKTKEKNQIIIVINNLDKIISFRNKKEINDHVDLIKFLIKSDSHWYKRIDSEKNNILHIVCRNIHLMMNDNLMSYLLNTENNKELISAKNKSGVTPLHGLMQWISMLKAEQCSKIMGYLNNWIQISSESIFEPTYPKNPERKIIEQLISYLPSLIKNLQQQKKKTLHNILLDEDIDFLLENMNNAFTEYSKRQKSEKADSFINLINKECKQNQEFCTYCNEKFPGTLAQNTGINTSDIISRLSNNEKDITEISSDSGSIRLSSLDSEDKSEEESKFKIISQDISISNSPVKNKVEKYFQDFFTPPAKMEMLSENSSSEMLNTGFSKTN